ncbi:MAG TPA: hypothetical protein VF179_31370 [Thermoanaerobaculia bacterium]|nr:hypothetical protein [Thermoanaerobaculia bacterium]
MKMRLRDLFLRRDNLLALVAIVAALIVVGLNLFTTYVSTEVLLSAVLLILGLSATVGIIERQERFERTEEKLEILERKLDALNVDFFLPRTALLPMREYIADADEVFCAGGHLMGFVVEHSALWEQWLGPGKRLKILVQDPDNPGLDHLEMPCGLYDAGEYRRQINVTLGRLQALQKKAPGSEIKVRLSKVTPSQTLSILDGQRGGTKMTMLLHVPEGDATIAPFIILNRAQHLKWFNLFYKLYYEQLWAKSKEFM